MNIKKSANLVYARVVRKVRAVGDGKECRKNVGLVGCCLHHFDSVGDARRGQRDLSSSLHSGCVRRDGERERMIARCLSGRGYLNPRSIRLHHCTVGVSSEVER